MKNRINWADVRWAAACVLIIGAFVFWIVFSVANAGVSLKSFSVQSVAPAAKSAPKTAKQLTLPKSTGIPLEAKIQRTGPSVVGVKLSTQTVIYPLRALRSLTYKGKTGGGLFLAGDLVAPDKGELLYFQYQKDLVTVVYLSDRIFWGDFQ